jgi:hypothetical protein
LLVRFVSIVYPIYIRYTEYSSKSVQKKNGDSFLVLRNNKFLQTCLNPIR